MRKSAFIALMISALATVAMAQDAAVTPNPPMTSDTAAELELSPEHAAEIRQVIVNAGVQPDSSLAAPIGLGDKVPQSVTLLPLPLRAIQLIPQFEGYLFCIGPDGKILVISPTALTVVLTL